jgi:hypothetical protein
VRDEGRKKARQEELQGGENKKSLAQLMVITKQKKIYL